MPNFKFRVLVKQCPKCSKPFETGGRGRPGKDQIYCSKRCNALATIRQPKISLLSMQHAAYMAGLLDGEGSIIMYDRGYGGRKQLRCTISNTYEPIMQWLTEQMNTGTVIRHIHPVEKGYRDSLTWQCYGQNAVSLLKQLLPFLIIKREKAEHAIESQKL